MTNEIIVWIYGALVLLGGVMGWAKAKSIPSLISGLVFGGVLIFLGFGIRQGRAADVTAACVIAGVLAVIMGLRFSKTKKFMPAGLVAVMSLVVLATLLMRR
ncbi:MAG: TMEM14 family protein [Verrucomicrobiota bacterium]